MYNIFVESGDLVVLPQDYGLLEGYRYDLGDVTCTAFHLKTGEAVDLRPPISVEIAFFEKDNRPLKTLMEKGLVFINHHYPAPLSGVNASNIRAVTDSEAGYGFFGTDKPQGFAMRVPVGESEYIMEPRLLGDQIIQSFRYDELSSENDIVAPIGSIHAPNGRLWLTDSAYLAKGGHQLPPTEIGVDTDVFGNALIMGIFGRDRFTEDSHGLKGLAFREAYI